MHLRMCFPNSMCALISHAILAPGWHLFDQSLTLHRRLGQKYRVDDLSWVGALSQDYGIHILRGTKAWDMSFLHYVHRYFKNP